MNTDEATRPQWHDALWSHMRRALQDDRVAHALLIGGASGVGKRLFAERIVKALLCRDRNDNGDACGHCPPCRQYAAQSHPDISRLMPEEPGRLIKVDQVRAFGHTLTLTPQYVSGRIGWIEPAEQLSISAANSLLKTLEEPPAGTHIVLISDRVSALMATIRSRCQHWQIPPATPEAGRVWLERHGVVAAGVDNDSLRTPLALNDRHERGYSELVSEWDADLAALLAGRADAVAVAERVVEQPADLWVDWLYRRSNALLTAALAGIDGAHDDSLPAPLARSASAIEPGVLQRWCAQVSESARLARTNAEWRLVVESLLLNLEQSLQRGSTR